MHNLKEVSDFFNDSKVMFLGTFDGSKVHVRPIGFVMLFNEKIYFSTAENGGVYNDLSNEKNMEVTAVNQNNAFNRIRINGYANFDIDSNVYEYFYESNPSMKNIPNLKLFSMEDWEATIYIDNNKIMLNNKS